ncbi:MAG: hypothetical protein GWO22_34135, partial [Actinobacteria bacterium]|nr:hypothetical protein [Actinomycetota bacterium]NIW32245.1 hypothetical protein [Actinomycetota bacterium]
QDHRSETIAWSRFGRMLEETNPILVDVALEQFLKFHRGDPETLLSVGPLLDHPQEDIRLHAARLIGQV